MSDDSVLTGEDTYDTVEVVVEACRGRDAFLPSSHALHPAFLSKLRRTVPPSEGVFHDFPGVMRHLLAWKFLNQLLQGS